MTGSDCVFCRIIEGAAPAEIVVRWSDATCFVPLNPVTDGHVLVVPNYHVRDAVENPLVTAITMGRAAEYAGYSCNLITSVGHHATQTVFHLHIHVVPRRPNDGLLLPWSSTPVTEGDLGGHHTAPGKS